MGPAETLIAWLSAGLWAVVLVLMWPPRWVFCARHSLVALVVVLFYWIWRDIVLWAILSEQCMKTKKSSRYFQWAWSWWCRMSCTDFTIWGGRTRLLSAALYLRVGRRRPWTCALQLRFLLKWKTHWLLTHFFCVHVQVNVSCHSLLQVVWRVCRCVYLYFTSRLLCLFDTILFRWLYLFF